MPLTPTRTRDYRRVIVERDAHAEFTVGPKGYRTRGGIDVPDPIARKGQTDRKNPRATFGTVRYVGQGVTEVRPGDRVCFWELAGSDILHNGERLTVLPETELLAVIG